MNTVKSHMIVLFPLWNQRGFPLLFTCVQKCVKTYSVLWTINLHKQYFSKKCVFWARCGIVLEAGAGGWLWVLSQIWLYNESVFKHSATAHNAHGSLCCLDWWLSHYKHDSQASPDFPHPISAPSPFLFIQDFSWHVWHPKALVSGPWVLQAPRLVSVLIVPKGKAIRPVLY